MRRAPQAGQRVWVRHPIPLHYSWFSSFADKWVMGVKGVYGASTFWNLSDRKCPDCDGQHPLDLASCVAFCSASSTHRARMVDSWGPNAAPQIHSWIQGLRMKGELRNFAGTLIPVSLYDALTVDSNGKRYLHDALAPRRKVLTSVVKDVCSYCRKHPLPDPPSPPLNSNTFFTSRGLYSTSDRFKGVNTGTTPLAHTARSKTVPAIRHRGT